MLTKLLIPHQYAPYVSLLAASLLVLPAGSMYGFGAYSTQLAVALGKRNSDVDTLGSAGDLGVYLGFTVGICWDICGSQITALVSLLLVGGGYLLNYLVLRAGLPFDLLYATYFLIGQGSYGMFVNGLSTTLRNFSPRHRGKVVGYMNSLFGISSVIFTAFYQHVLDQNVESYFLLLAGCTLAGNLVGFLFVEELNRGHRLGTRWCTHWQQERRELAAAEMAQLEQQQQQSEDSALLSAVAEQDDRTLATASPKPTLHSASVLSSNSDLGQDASPFSSAALIATSRDTYSPTGTSASPREERFSVNLTGELDQALQSPTSSGCSKRERAHLLEAALGQESTGLTLLRSPDFYLIFFGFFMVSGTGLMWKNIVGSVTNAFGLPGSEASNLVMTWGLVNALSRLVAGLLSDTLVARVPRPSWMVLANLVMLLSHVCYLLIDVPSVLWVVDVGTGIGYGFAFALFNGLLVIYFGTRYVGLNLGMLNLAPAIGGTLFTALSTQLVNAATPSSESDCVGPLCYQYTFVLSSCGLTVGLWIVLVLTYRHYAGWFRRIDEHSPLGAVEIHDSSDLRS